MKINEYFDKVICINLAKRNDRWEEMQKQFKKHNIKVSRFNAIDGNPMGWNGWKNVLIIEDDCDFIDDLNKMFEESIKTLPNKWDLLYFGGVHETRGGKFVPEKFNKFFVKAKRIITTTCYAVNHTAYDLILDTVLEKKPYFDCPIDTYLGAYIQPNLETYAYHPPIAWQRPSHSDIQNAHRDYSEMMKNNNVK